MGQGLGHVQRAILAFVDADDFEERYAAEDLALTVFQPKRKSRRRARKSEMNSIYRSMRGLAARFPDRFAVTGGQGREPLWLVRVVHKRGRAVAP
jgi:hypothetical protein